MDAFKQFGDDIESKWRATHYDERAFPTLAVEALREAQIHDRICANDVIRWLLGAQSLPEQLDIEAKFGEPPVTVYNGRRFTIQVIFWFTASTSIHAHAFSGAFQVLQGSSLHSVYEFHEKQRYSTHFRMGDLCLRQVERLKRGDLIPIDGRLLHSLYHLDAPSATIVVRTYRDADAFPQYEYHPPSIALDPFYEEVIVKRWLQACSLLIRTKHPDYETHAAEVIRRNDIHTAFLVLQQAVALLDDSQILGRLFDVVRQSHGSVGNELIAALRMQIFRRKFVKLRKDIQDPTLRFFLALLQNLPHRAAIVQMVRKYEPGGDPRKQIISWTYALSGVDRIGVDFSGDFERTLFEALFDDGSDENAFKRLRSVFDSRHVDAQAEAILTQAARMRQTLLQPLFLHGQF